MLGIKYSDGQHLEITALLILLTNAFNSDINPAESERSARRVFWDRYGHLELFVGYLLELTSLEARTQLLLFLVRLTENSKSKRHTVKRSWR